MHRHRQLQVTRGALVALLLVACGQSRRPGSKLEDAPSVVRAPATADQGARCADVGEGRVCWKSATEAGVVAVPRPAPPSPVPARGYRCAGAGLERECRDRALGSDAFSCSGDRCTQRHPRLPDDGEWECADLDSVVVCRGWSDAAGIVAGKPDPGWYCGARRGAASERICVDFSADRPDAEPWSCRFQYEPGAPTRVCTRGGEPPLGRKCDKGCPFGSVCRGERCLPLEPAPSCWSDKDCPAGDKCAFGTCREVPK